jgi:hypothetical protein
MAVSPNENLPAEIEEDTIDELLFLQLGLYYFFESYEDEDIFYQEKYSNHAKN